MEPGEGSAAPKATVALPGTDVNPAGRAPARLAVHCILATGGPGAAMRHAPFGRPPAPFGYFPVWESTSSARRRTKPPTRNSSLVAGRKRAYLQRISPLRRRPGGFPLAPWTPSGPILICVGKTSHEKQTSCRRQEKALPFFFPYRKGFRLCGGDQRAFRSPFGNLRPFAAHGGFHRRQISCGRQEKSLLALNTRSSVVSRENFASAEATRGLSARPLDPFGEACVENRVVFK